MNQIVSFLSGQLVWNIIWNGTVALVLSYSISKPWQVQQQAVFKVLSKLQIIQLVGFATGAVLVSQVHSKLSNFMAKIVIVSTIGWFHVISR